VNLVLRKFVVDDRGSPGALRIDAADDLRILAADVP